MTLWGHLCFEQCLHCEDCFIYRKIKICPAVSAQICMPSLQCSGGQLMMTSNIILLLNVRVAVMLEFNRAFVWRDFTF